MMITFIDSGPFRALNNTADQYFSSARQRYTELINVPVKLVTTDYVIDEVYTGLLVDSGYRSAINFDNVLRLGKWVVEKISADRFTKAQEVFCKFNKDKKWSFTDCTSYVVMKELKINTVFTFDDNFKQMGFKVL